MADTLYIGRISSGGCHRFRVRGAEYEFRDGDSGMDETLSVGTRYSRPLLTLGRSGVQTTAVGQAKAASTDFESVTDPNKV